MRLITVISLQFGTGLRMDPKRIGEFCGERKILFSVDAIQGIGADFAMADGHKWMLDPEGPGVFYCGPEAREMVRFS